MFELNKYKIGTRLAFSFGVVIFLVLLMVLTGLVRLQGVKDQTTQFIHEDWVKTDAANTVDIYTRANAQRVMEYIFAQDNSVRADYRKLIDFNKQTITDALKRLDQLVQEPEAREEFDYIATARVEYVNSFEHVLELVDNGHQGLALDWLVTQTLPILDKLRDPITNLNTIQHRLATQGGEATLRNITITNWTYMILGAIIVVLSIVLALVITRSIVRPLGRAVGIAEVIASGDLSQDIQVAGRDETSQLLGALQRMNNSLQAIIGQVYQGAESIATATRQIAGGNTDLASRTEEQASALTETAASMGQLTSTVHQNYEHGQHAYQIAESASKVAVEGGEVVGQVVHAMAAINESSNKISEIIGLIDSIAFQTNILALNAAVEAARAGESGRGFAVVASEVRALAQRSASAARDIGELISTSGQHVHEGSQYVERAGSTMDEIVVSVRRVADLMSDIARASQEQSSGIEQINLAMTQMEEVTQSNAALVEQAAVAAQSLDDQANGLIGAVSRFKV